MTKYNKVMRYQIIKPLSDDWNVLGTVLRQVTKETRTVLNKTIQLCWEWEGFSADFKELNGRYPKLEEFTKYKQLHGYVYDRLKERFPTIHKGNFSQTIKRATDKWKADKKEIIKGDRSIPSYKKDVPIDLISDCMKVMKSGHDYVLHFSLLSNPGKTKFGKKRSAFDFDVLLAVKDRTQRVILDRILNGEYQLSASQLVYRKGKWILLLNYKFDKQNNPLDPNRIMGIDMGIKYPIYIAFNDSLHRYHISGGEIDQFRKHVETRRKELLKQGKYCGDGRLGHGRQTRIQPIEVLSQKIANFRDTTNHKYARYVVNLALKHGCGTIQMEELKGISKDDAFLKNWTYHDLQQKIEYKANEVGIQVIKVQPKYTSQRCSKCGFIAKENRESQSDFRCVSCGYETFADYNAARNIATHQIEKIIQDQVG